MGKNVLPTSTKGRDNIVSLKNYIVRIYRCRKNNPRSLVGIVEEVGVKGKKAFTNYDELWEILNSVKARVTRRRRETAKRRVRKSKSSEL